MIRTCLFDLGNVLLKFSHEKMYQQIANVMEVDVSIVRGEFSCDKLFWRYEAGEIETSELLARFRKLTAKPFSNEEWLFAASDIFEEIHEMVRLLNCLKDQGKKLVLVSNTSDMHMSFAQSRYPFFKQFDELVFSYQIKAMKPEQAFYDAALKTAKVRPEQCVFIDDMPQNIEGARKRGILSHLFKSPHEVEAFLREAQILTK